MCVFTLHVEDERIADRNEQVLLSVFVYRYSDFVVHEINKEGKTVQLDDLSIPVETEVRKQFINL